MNKSEIYSFCYDTLRELVAEQIDIKDDSNIIIDLKFDSLMLLCLLVVIEDKYGSDISKKLNSTQIQPTLINIVDFIYSELISTNSIAV